MPLRFRRNSQGPLNPLDHISWKADFVLTVSAQQHFFFLHWGSDCICFWCIIQVYSCTVRQVSITQFWCPYDCPTPYPHSLTSISLLVSPQQIRKASQHLHGDGPQSSRWPQCAARQLKRERRAGKRKWVRIRGEQGRQREAASASGLRTDVCICALSDAHAHAYMRVFIPQCTPSRVFPAKTNTHPTPVMKLQQRENEKRG